MLRIVIDGVSHDIPEKDVEVFRVDKNGNTTNLLEELEASKVSFADVAALRRGRRNPADMQPYGK